MSLTVANIREAATAIAPTVLRTPLIQVPRLEDVLQCNHRLFLKCDNLQRCRSFKERGATYAVSKLPAAARAKGVITRSSGNFAQALALAGAQRGVPVTVVMPTHAPAIKVAGTKKFGAIVVQHGTTHQEGLAKMAELQAAHGYTYVAPFDDADVMVGQGTVALEIFDALPSVRSFFCPVGGGGLLGGCCIAFKGLNPAIEMVGVEPATADDFARSLKAGALTPGAPPSTIADGLLAPTVGQVNWPVLMEHVDAVEVIEDSAIIAAMRLLYIELGMVVEPSGAVALAGFMQAKKARAFYGDVVCMVSGGNVDLERFHQLLS